MGARSATLVGLCLVGLPAVAADWPQFRGPDGKGLADERRAPAEWGRDKNVLWKVKIPGVAWSSPIVAGDKVFVTSAVTDNQRKPQGGGFGGGGRPPGEYCIKAP